MIPDSSYHICLTGHRPNNLPGGYDYSHPFYAALYSKLKEMVEHVLRYQDSVTLHSGMALGSDTVWAHVAVDLAALYPGRVFFYAEVPFPQQASRWKDADQKRWEYLLHFAHETRYVGTEYAPHLLMERNKVMIDSSTAVIAICNKDTRSGGTYHAVQYAKKQGKGVFNIDPETVMTS